MPRNLLLDSLPKDDKALLDQHLEQVRVELLDVLVEPGDRIDYVYFPLDLMVSVVSCWTQVNQ